MRTVFVKSNFQYAPQYCVVTRITIGGQGVRSVRKVPMGPESLEHIRDMERSSKELPALLRDLDICPCHMEGDEAVFSYEEGSSFYGYILAQSRLSREQGLAAWKRMLSLVVPAEEAAVPFHTSPAFERMFGPGEAFEGEPAFPVCAFDITPSNILIRKGKKPVLIDYEWRIDGPVPAALIRYHAVTTAYRSYKEMREHCPPVEDVLALAGLAAPEECYRQAMEHYFDVIFAGGEDRPTYAAVRGRYQVAEQTDFMELLAGMNSRIREQEEWIRQQEKFLHYREQQLAEKDQVLAEKDKAIADKDAWIGQQEEFLHYREQQLAERDQALAEKDKAIADKDAWIGQQAEFLRYREQQLAEKDQALAEKDAWIGQQAEFLRYRENQLEDRNRAAEELRLRLDETTERLSAIENSSIWRMTSFLHK